MRHIALFVNPFAGKGKPLQVLPVLLSAIERKGISYEVIKDQFPETLSRFTDIVIVGGDGTINYIINRYRDISIPIGIVPAGSGNDLAYTLCPEAEMMDQIENALLGNIQLIDAGFCNDRIFLNCLGVGFDGEVAKEVQHVKWLSGKLKYYWVVVKKILSYRSSSLEVYWKDGKISGPVFMITAANGFRSGGGFKVAPGADWHDGLLELVIIHPLPVWKRFRYLPWIEKGEHLDLPFIENYKTEIIRIRSEKMIAGHMDGEIINSDHFDISVMRGRYQFRGKVER
jgi:diacylglycerol kinase (ATP)